MLVGVADHNSGLKYTLPSVRISELEASRNAFGSMSELLSACLSKPLVTSPLLRSLEPSRPICLDGLQTVLYEDNWVSRPPGVSIFGSKFSTILRPSPFHL